MAETQLEVAMKSIASGSDRNTAVTRGQENMEGLKEVNIRRILKQNSEGEYVVTESVRNEMVYDDFETAFHNYKDIENAKEDVAFEHTGEDMATTVEEPKAAFVVGMKVQARYDIKAKDVLHGNKFLVFDGQKSGWVSEAFLRIAEENPNICIDVEKNELMDNGSEEVQSNEPVAPTDFSKMPAFQQAEDFTRNNGYATMVVPSPGANSMVGKASGEAASLLQPGFSVSRVEDELKLGVDRELEHVADPAKALEIAIDHVAEDNSYYTKLNQVMPECGPETKPERNVAVSEVDSNEPQTMEEAVKSFQFEAAYKADMGTRMGTTNNALRATASIEELVQRSVGELAENIINILRNKESLDFGETDAELTNILDLFKEEVKEKADLAAARVSPAEVDQASTFETDVEYPTNEEQDNQE